MAGIVVGLLPKDCCLCECIANFGIPCLAERRESVLKTTMFLSSLGFLMAILGVVGGFSSSGIGEVLPWVKFEGVLHKDDEYYVGLKYACNAATHNCTKLGSGDCKKLHLGDSCTDCLTVANQAYIPSVLCAVTYLLYAHNTWKRVDNKDSNQAKIMCLFACFFAGSTFLGTLVTYYQSCVTLRQYKAEVGLGMVLMGLGGVVLKLVCGFLHLSIPVVNAGSSELGGVVAGPADRYAGIIDRSDRFVAGAPVRPGPTDNCCACAARPGEECTVCGVSCGGGTGVRPLAYVGVGQGQYIQETTFTFVGVGGDFGIVRPRRDFTCIICVSGLLMLIPLLLWLLSGLSTSVPFDCEAGMDLPGSDQFIDDMWSPAQKDYCCTAVGKGCATTALPETTVTVPPTPFPTPPPTPPRTPPPTAPEHLAGPVDPYNCAVGQYSVWEQAKQQWCCRIHHICGLPAQAPAPADPYNCQDGFTSWQAAWSVAKKEWCCRVHGKGCPNQGRGCVTPSEPYDCDAGLTHWMTGWSVEKKAWCCANKGKGCPLTAGGCA